MHQILTPGFRLSSANGRRQQEPGGWEESQVVFTLQAPSLFSVGRGCLHSWPSLNLQLQGSTASGTATFKPGVVTAPSTAGPRVLRLSPGLFPLTLPAP